MPDFRMNDPLFTPDYFFDRTYCPLPGLYEGVTYAWQALERLPAILEEQLVPGVHPEARVSPGAYVGDKVSIGAGTIVEHGVSIPGPAIIGGNCLIRSGAYIRDMVVAGDGSILGYCCEFKRCILHAGAEVFHFAYVGDSILGNRAHLGAGVKISNVKLGGGTVSVSGPDGPVDTGLVKFGAVLGDRCDIGCNAVLNPGTLVGPGSIIYPNASWRGVLPAGHIAKLKHVFEVVRRRD